MESIALPRENNQKTWAWRRCKGSNTAGQTQTDNLMLQKNTRVASVPVDMLATRVDVIMRLHDEQTWGGTRGWAWEKKSTAFMKGKGATHYYWRVCKVRHPRKSFSQSVSQPATQSGNWPICSLVRHLLSLSAISSVMQLVSLSSSRTVKCQSLIQCQNKNTNW